MIIIWILKNLFEPILIDLYDLKGTSEIVLMVGFVSRTVYNPKQSIIGAFTWIIKIFENEIPTLTEVFRINYGGMKTKRSRLSYNKTSQ